MGWFDGWLNQTVSWKVLVSEDSRNWNTYADPVSIRARKEERMIEATGPGGLERRQGNTVWVEEDVALGDLIDGEVVQGRDSRTDMDGLTVGYELRTEP